MKNIILTSALVVAMCFTLNATTTGKNDSLATRVTIQQLTSESVEVYVAKIPDLLVKIVIYNESGDKLISTRTKKQKTRYIRFHLNELPTGNYTIKVEQEGNVIAEYKLKK